MDKSADWHIPNPELDRKTMKVVDKTAKEWEPESRLAHEIEESVERWFDRVSRETPILIYLVDFGILIFLFALSTYLIK